MHYHAKWIDKPTQSILFRDFVYFLTPWALARGPVGPVGPGPWPVGPMALGPLALGPVARRALGPVALGPWALAHGSWARGPWARGPWPLGPWALGPRAQGVLVLKTGEADRPKCAFPRPLVVIVAV